MVRVVIEDKKGLVQKAGGGVAIEPKLELKNHTALKVPPGSSGALGYKVDRGVLVGASITTGIARASAVASGAHTLTAVNVSKGHVTVTASFDACIFEVLRTYVRLHVCFSSLLEAF